MADSVRTNIRQAFKARLETITQANGYLTNVANVYTEDVDLESIPQFPAICIILGNEEVVSALDSTGVVEKKLTAFLDCYVEDPATLQDSIDNLIQDIERCLLRSIEGYGLNGACSELYPVSAQPFYLSINSPNGAVTITMSVYYSQKLTDPTLQGHE